MQNYSETLTALQKASIICKKYSKKYTANKSYGKISYDVLSVDRTNANNSKDLLEIADYIKQKQSTLLSESRHVIFIGCNASLHVKSIIVTPKYVFINRADSVSPYIEQVLQKAKLKPIIVLPYLEEKQKLAYIQVDTGCATVAGKVAKHIAYLTDAEHNKIIAKKKVNEDLTLNGINFVDTESFEHYVDFSKNLPLAQNIMKYSEMPRFDRFVTTAHNINLNAKAFYTKIKGNDGERNKVFFDSYINSHLIKKDEREWRNKLQEEEQKYISMGSKS